MAGLSPAGLQPCRPLPATKGFILCVTSKPIITRGKFEFITMLAACCQYIFTWMIFGFQLTFQNISHLLHRPGNDHILWFSQLFDDEVVHWQQRAGGHECRLADRSIQVVVFFP